MGFKGKYSPKEHFFPSSKVSNKAHSRNQGFVIWKLQNENLLNCFDRNHIMTTRVVTKKEISQKKKKEMGEKLVVINKLI